MEEIGGGNQKVEMPSYKMSLGNERYRMVTIVNIIALHIESCYE